MNLKIYKIFYKSETPNFSAVIAILLCSSRSYRLLLCGRRIERIKVTGLGDITLLSSQKEKLY